MNQNMVEEQELNLFYKEMMELFTNVCVTQITILKGKILGSMSNGPYRKLIKKRNCFLNLNKFNF